MRFAMARAKDEEAETMLDLLMMTFLVRRLAVSLLHVLVEESVLAMMLIVGSHDSGLWSMVRATDHWTLKWHLHIFASCAEVLLISVNTGGVACDVCKNRTRFWSGLMCYLRIGTSPRRLLASLACRQ